MKFEADWKVALGLAGTMVVGAIIGQTMVAVSGEEREFFWYGIGEWTRLGGVVGCIAFLAIALANYAGSKNKCTTSQENVRLGNSGTSSMMEALVTFVVTLVLALVLGAHSKLFMPALYLGGVVFSVVVLKMAYNRGRCNDARMVADLRRYERGELGWD